MNILEELKISKKQNKHERYEYLCSQFNAIDYCIRLEKYTNKLQQENKILKENAENNDKVVDKVNWENMLLKKENKQLKEEIEEYKNPIKYFKYANKNVTEENKQLKVRNLIIAAELTKLQDENKQLKDKMQELEKRK